MKFLNNFAGTLPCSLSKQLPYRFCLDVVAGSAGGGFWRHRVCALGGAPASRVRRHRNCQRLHTLPRTYARPVLALLRIAS